MWLYIPSVYAQESEASSEDLNSRHLNRLSRCCTASGKSAQPRSLRKRLKEVAYQPLRSGLTLRPSQAVRSLDTWIESAFTQSQAAIPANRFLKPVSDLARTMNATYGRALLERLHAIHQNCCSSKMSQGILFSDFQKSSTVWNEWITGLRAVCSPRLKSVQDTEESESSFWPTAAARDHKGSSANRDRTSGALDEAAEQLWATPQAVDAKEIVKDAGKARLKRGGCKTLADDISHRFHQDQQAATGETSLSDGRNSHQQLRTKRLNPLFVAWLMGYLEPINCGPMETRSSHILQRWLSSVCGQH